MQTSQFISLGDMKVFQVPVASACLEVGRLSGLHLVPIFGAQVIFPMWDCLGTVGSFPQVLLPVISSGTPVSSLKHISDA